MIFIFKNVKFKLWNTYMRKKKEWKSNYLWWYQIYGVKDIPMVVMHHAWESVWYNSVRKLKTFFQLLNDRMQKVFPLRQWTICWIPIFLCSVCPHFFDHSTYHWYIVVKWIILIQLIVAFVDKLRWFYNIQLFKSIVYFNFLNLTMKIIIHKIILIFYY